MTIAGLEAYETHTRTRSSAGVRPYVCSAMIKAGKRALGVEAVYQDAIAYDTHGERVDPDTLTADESTVEDAIVTGEEVASRLRVMDADTRAFALVWYEPPTDMIDAVRALQARSEYALSRGIATPAPRSFSPHLVRTLLCFSRSEYDRAMKTFEALV